MRRLTGYGAPSRVLVTTNDDDTGYVKRTEGDPLMDAFVFFLAMIAALVLLDVAALRFGVDPDPDGRDDARYRFGPWGRPPGAD
jgi:hypothetical protein